MKDSCGHGVPAAPNPCWPASDSRYCPVDSIDALTLPSVARQQHYAVPLVVAAVDELTLPYSDPGRAEQHNRSAQTGRSYPHWLWMMGHGLLLLGVFVLATVGSVWADAQAQIAAARGDTDVPGQIIRATSPAGPATRPRTPPAHPSIQPELTQPQGTIPVLSGGSAVGVPTAVVDTTDERSTITRLVIPVIHLDKNVAEVGWALEAIADQAVAVWEVDRYRVGHHQGSSNPGGGSNIVLAGHSGGTAYPFNDLFYLKPGDLVEVYSAGQLYQYTVSEHYLVDEVGQPLATRLENARFMEPTDEEVITMIACWPLTGPKKFTQRVIIRATPIQLPAIVPKLSPIHSR